MITYVQYFGLLWWIYPLQGADWIALGKFILEERSYNPLGVIINITRWESLTWSINNICFDFGHKYKISLKVLKLNQSNDLNFSQKP